MCCCLFWSVIHPIWNHNCHITHLTVLKTLLQEIVGSKPNVSRTWSYAVCILLWLCVCVYFFFFYVQLCSVMCMCTHGYKLLTIFTTLALSLLSGNYSVHVGSYRNGHSVVWSDTKKSQFPANVVGDENTCNHSDSTVLKQYPLSVFCWILNCKPTSTVSDITWLEDVFDALLFISLMTQPCCILYGVVLYGLSCRWATVFCAHASQSCMCCPRVKGTVKNVLQPWHEP